MKQGWFSETRREFVAVFGVLISLTALFIVLRTRQYLAVDGAIRCLTVYWRAHPTAAGNNHLLYFVNAFAWMKVLSLLSVKAKDAFDFMRLMHWMDALAAAGSIAMFWILCCRAARSFVAAFAASCAYAFSNAFLLHATSTAEPMMGLFWSIVSISVVASGLVASSRLRLFAGGALLLLAMATYESMVLIGPAELILICNWDERGGLGHNRRLALWFLAGCGLGGLTAYVPVYAISGTTTPLEMLRRFLDMGGGSQVYGAFGASKLLNVPVGFANSIVPSLPVSYQGIRSLLGIHRHDRWILLSATAVLVTASWLAWTAQRLALVWPRLDHRRRLILACVGITLVFDAFPLVFWDPLYDKLWLQPLAVVFFAWSVIFSAWRQLCRPRMMLLPETLFIMAIFASGSLSAIQASQSPTPCLGAARDLSQILRRSDLLVTDWDLVSLLYSAFWGDGANRFDVPATATGIGPRTVPLLDDELVKIQSSAGRAYFLGVLDLPEGAWTSYLGNRCHLPYHSLDRMRACAKPVAKLACNETDEILWQLSFDCYKP